MECVPTTRLTVRPAVQGDADDIGNVHAAAWLAAYDDIFEPEFLKGAAQGRRIGYRQLLPELLAAPKIFLVAVRDGTLVGFVHATPQTSEPALSEILGFYLHPDVWGSGVADTLMAQTLQSLAVDTEDVVLWTLRDAARARRFYEKAGFQATGRQRSETLTDWSSATSVERPAVEYARTLAPQRAMLGSEH
jgi:RimJ/RimL family protein N-acetyltransferase